MARRPRLVLAVWFLVLGILFTQGTGLAGKVFTGPIFVDGSEAQQEHALSEREFGNDSPLVVMLRGPAAALNRQGEALVERLDSMPKTLVNSPWKGGQAIEGLSPGPEVATLLIGAGNPPGATSEDTVRLLEHEVHRLVSTPVRASIAGGLPLSYALRNSAEEATRSAELLAIPVLLIVLLFVYRSLVAAVMPLLIGGMVVGASQGTLSLFAGKVAVSPFALAAASMLGLALGVDYALLVVSRFREERKSGDDVAAAVERTVRATGRSIVPAGCGLVLAMLVASQLLPSNLIASVAVAVVAASAFSVISAIFATPATLMLVDKHLDRWSLPRPRSEDGLILRGAQWISRRPAMVLLVVFGLFLCAVWAFTLQTDIGTLAELPDGNSTKIQHEAVERTLGPGWLSPFEVIVDADDGPVTTPQRLHALSAFQREVEGDPGVATMTGFSKVERGSDQLRKFGPALAAQQRGIGKIGDGLTKVKAGSAAATSGLVSAQNGAEELHAGVGQTVTGSGLIADGLQKTAKGSERLGGGLEELDRGSGNLTEGATKSSNGASRIAEALKKASERSAESSDSSQLLENALGSGESSLLGLNQRVQSSGERLAAAKSALERMTVGSGDPQYAAAVAAVNEASLALGASGEPGAEPAGVQAGIEHAQSQFSLGLYLAGQIAKNGRASEKGIAKLAQASQKLDHGLQRLADGSQDLSDGVAKLSEGGAALSPGLRKLSASAQRLAGGLGELGAGAGGLASGLGRGVLGSSQLTTALGRLDAGSQRLQGPGGEGAYTALTKQSPGLFDSGYFFLASLDGSKTAQREQARSLVNLAEGGSAARMLVIPRDDPSSAEAESTEDRLQVQADRLARRAHADVVVGGVTPTVTDLNDTLRAQAPMTRFVLSIVTILILLFVTRSLVLSVLAAVLNLLTVSATFGVTSLLFNGSLLGGPGYVETLAIPVTIILVFALAIDYEVFIFSRMREEYLRTGSTSMAIDDGLGRSARVVTGAAMIMISVFLIFALTPVAGLRPFGVSLAIAIFIDAFVIRFVILPATMRALGDRSWWMPRWLDRLLPGGASPMLASGADR